MKQSLIFFLLLPTILFGQELKDSVKKGGGNSNIEKFSEKTGTLIQKEFMDIGSIGPPYHCKIEFLIISDLVNNAKSEGVFFENHIYGELFNTNIGYLDADEIDATMKAIKIIQTTILPKKVTNYTEVIFTSRGGFSFICKSKGLKWEIYMEVNNYSHSNEALVPLKESEIDTLYSYFQNVKNKL